MAEDSDDLELFEDDKTTAAPSVKRTVLLVTKTDYVKDRRESETAQEAEMRSRSAKDE